MNNIVRTVVVPSEPVQRVQHKTAVWRVVGRQGCWPEERHLRAISASEVRNFRRISRDDYAVYARAPLSGRDAISDQRVTGERPDILPGHTLAPASRRDEPENHLDISLAGRRPTPKSIASLENRISLFIPSGHG